MEGKCDTNSNTPPFGDKLHSKLLTWYQSSLESLLISTVVKSGIINFSLSFTHTHTDTHKHTHSEVPTARVRACFNSSIPHQLCRYVYVIWKKYTVSSSLIRVGWPSRVEPVQTALITMSSKIQTHQFHTFLKFKNILFRRAALKFSSRLEIHHCNRCSHMTLESITFNFYIKLNFIRAGNCLNESILN